MKFSLSKIATIVLIFFLLLTIWYLFEMNEVSRHNVILSQEAKKTVDAKIVEIYEEKKALEAQMATIENSRKDLADRVTSYETQLQGLSSEYEAKMESLRAELEAAKAQTAQEIAKKDTEIAELKKMAEENQKDSDGKKSNRAVNKKPGEEEVKLEAITITTPKGRKKDVSVLEVNRDYGFIVIDMGKGEGIKEGDLLYVFRNKKLLGRVIVERVDEQISVAKLLYKEVTDNVRKGDKVSY